MEKSFGALLGHLRPGSLSRRIDSDSKKYFNFVKRDNNGVASFVCYARQATFLGRVYLREMEAVQVDSEGCKFCCLSEAMFRKICASLLQDHYCIKIWRKNGVSNENNAWVLEDVVTPGDLSAAPYLSSGLDCLALASVCIASDKNGQTIGVAFSTSPIDLLQFDQYEQRDVLSRLQSLLLQYGIRECMVFCCTNERSVDADISSIDCPLISKLLRLLKELEILCSCVDVTHIPAKHYIIGEIKEAEAHAILSRICCSVETELGAESTNYLSAALFSRPSGTAALIRLFQRLNMWDLPDESRGAVGINFPTLHGVMICDTSTYDLLRVFDSNRKVFKYDSSHLNSVGGIDSNHPQTLYSVLNSCRSHMGKKMLKRWLKQPSTDLSAINQRHEIVQLFSAESVNRENIQSLLDGLPDVDSIVWRLNGAPTKKKYVHSYLFDVVALHKFVQRSVRIKEVLSELQRRLSTVRSTATMRELVDPIEQNIQNCYAFLTYVDDIIDVELVERVERDNWRSVAGPLGPESREGVATIRTDEPPDSSEEYEESTAQGEIYLRIGGSTYLEPGASDTASGWGDGDGYDRFNKQTWVRIKPSISDELSILDETYRNSWRQLESERKRIHTCLTGLDVPTSASCWTPQSPVDSVDADGLSPQSKKRRLSVRDRTSSELKSNTPDNRKKNSKSSTPLITIERNSNNGYHLRMKKKNWHLVYSAKEKERLRDVGVDILFVSTTSKTGVTFTTKQFSALANKCAIIRERYCAAESDLILEVLSRTKMNLSCIRNLSALVARLDCLLCYAEISERLGWTQPLMSPPGSRNMKILKVRDPVVEARVGVTDYVPSDYDMNESIETTEYSDGAFLLSGPNMGGKTTFMRAVASACLLAHIGCFVPASEAIIPVYDKLLCHRPCGENIVNGTSCFMSDMLDVSRIVSTCSCHSLILLDELGVGTSTSTGIGIVIATISRLVCEIGCTVILATNYSEIIDMVSEIDRTVLKPGAESDREVLLPRIKRVRSFRVAASLDCETRLSYQVGPSSGGSSPQFALTVAKAADIPEELLNDAGKMLLNGCEY